VSDFSIVYHSIRLPAPTPGIVRDARSVLAIASPDPRKNLACLYDALSQHKNVFGAMGPPQLDVVCTNADAARRAEGELMGRGIRDYRLLTQLSDQALADAYSAATAFAFPSLREGFGLPPVEAMSLGTPVVASNAEPMPEILGDAALLFSPDSPDELARQLALVLNHTAEQARLSTLGRERAGLYTPRAQGEGTLAAWKAAR
jgi:glycosyltransferase involved in cell wall biosynthesis